MPAYGDDVGLQALAAARGVTLPSDQSGRDSLRAQATLFVDGLGYRIVNDVPVNRFPGKPTVATQLEAWPRTGATDAYGNEIASGDVPTAVIQATYEAALIEVGTAGVLNAVTRNDQRLIREKYDVVEFQYSDPGAGGKSDSISAATPVIPAVMTLMARFMAGGSNPYGITAVVV